jgi:hypothetical protein
MAAMFGAVTSRVQGVAVEHAVLYCTHCTARTSLANDCDVTFLSIPPPVLD